MKKKLSIISQKHANIPQATNNCAWYCLFVINDANISARHFFFVYFSLVQRERLIYDCYADNSSCFVVAQATSPIKCNFASVCLQAQQLQAQSLSRPKLQAALPSVRLQTRRSRCGTFGTIQRFCRRKRRRALLQLHP